MFLGFVDIVLVYIILEGSGIGPLQITWHHEIVVLYTLCPTERAVGSYPATDVGGHKPFF